MQMSFKIIFLWLTTRIALFVFISISNYAAVCPLTGFCVTGDQNHRPYAMPIEVSRITLYNPNLFLFFYVCCFSSLVMSGRLHYVPSNVDRPQ